MAGRGELPQQVEGQRVGGESGVVVEGAGVGEEVLRRLGDEAAIRQHVGGARGEIGQGAAGVGEDDFAAGVLAQSISHDEVDGRSDRFVWVVDHGLG